MVARVSIERFGATAAQQEESTQNWFDQSYCWSKVSQLSEAHLKQLSELAEAVQACKSGRA